jgi:hypothetical protein
MKSFLGWMNEKPKTSSNLMDHVLDGPKNRAEAERKLKEQGIEKPKFDPKERMKCAPTWHSVMDAVDRGIAQAEAMGEAIGRSNEETAADAGFFGIAYGTAQFVKDSWNMQSCMDNQDAEYQKKLAEYDQEVGRLMPKIPLNDRLPKSEMEKQGQQYWKEHWKYQNQYEAWKEKWATYHRIKNKYALTIDGWKESDERIKAKAENAQRYKELITGDGDFLYAMFSLPGKYREYLEWRNEQFFPDDGLRYKDVEQYSFQEIDQRVHARNTTRQEQAMILDTLDQHLERTKPRFR